MIRGDSDTARRLAERALAALERRTTVDSARSRMALAAALAEQGDRDAALDHLSGAGRTLEQVATSRRAAKAWVELANTLERVGDPVGAVQAFRDATAAVNLPAHGGTG